MSRNLIKNWLLLVGVLLLMTVLPFFVSEYQLNMVITN